MTIRNGILLYGDDAARVADKRRLEQLSVLTDTIDYFDRIDGVTGVDWTTV